MVYDINNKSHKDTTKFVYAFDHKDRVIAKTKHFGNWSSIETYSDFDTLNNPTTVRHTFNKNTSIEKKSIIPWDNKYLNYRINEDTITSPRKQIQ